ncbi:hypothetical protein PRUPE_3G200100 [Prunus persica]|uniref:Uncharacterized protein n=1 Tax=Prunus persica TaxID=3760 RepID=M5WYK6_PRUPE|nr:hypothetical protein PRUPE_3G200100 [Prunus persica]
MVAASSSSKKSSIAVAGKGKKAKHSALVPVICALELFLWPLLSSFDTHHTITSHALLRAPSIPSLSNSKLSPKLHFSFCLISKTLLFFVTYNKNQMLTTYKLVSE